MMIQHGNGQERDPSFLGNDAIPVTNPELKLANDFVQYTNCNVFLTGKAGTGKTTFLHSLRKKTPKRMIVTAPTGVAAINAGGVTLHSFFQIPFGPFIPGTEPHARNGKRKFNRDKINIIKSLDLLVIDEISMVRADLLDCVDGVLRTYRRSNRPFGGVQLLMIGDLHQLSPVVKDDEWAMLREHYDSAYFFGSNSLRQTELVPIELKHIYRQSDSQFIELLNRVRDNNLDSSTLKKLNSRYIEGFTPKDDEGYITLSTHNRSADAINKSKLQASSAKSYSFTAEVEGDFPEHTYPTLARLELKVGAQVMFVRNDSSHEKLFFNGKIGKITRIFDSYICVQCPGDSNEIIVEKITWENIKYTMDSITKEIKEEKIGTFVQYPLKLAWAITIHKSQGLTFEKAIIDAHAAFAHGQVYVALSRCKTFEGMLLSSPISPNAVKTDGAVLHFVQGSIKDPPSQDKLDVAKTAYQHRLLIECFDFERLGYYLRHLGNIVAENSQVIQVSGEVPVSDLESKVLGEVCEVSENFKRQLNRLFANNGLPESDANILDRLGKASAYFQKKIEEILEKPLETIRMETDNKELEKRLDMALDQLKKETKIKLAAVTSCQAGFSPAHYLKVTSAAEIDFKSNKKRQQKGAGGSFSNMDHPALLQALKDWRLETAAREKIQKHRILPQKTLLLIATKLPKKISILKKIKGIGKGTAQKYGQELVSLVTSYCETHSTEGVTIPESKSASKSIGAKQETTGKVDTKTVSFNLFQKGLSVDQVAKKRGLVNGTIEGHLAFFVGEGRLEIEKTLSAKKRETIEEKLEGMKDSSFGEIKQALGDDFSYGEIKIVQAHQNYQKESKRQ